jgi:FkbM family methyltransferase
LRTQVYIVDWVVKRILALSLGHGDPHSRTSYADCTVSRMLSWASIWRVFSPPYFFRPQQIFIRARRELSGQSEPRTTVQLPWGLLITIDPNEAISHNIATLGLYEPVVTETLWRLADGDKLAVDAGANIGYTASILGARLGSEGRVLCFEPHPQVFASLQNNVSTWENNPRCAKFELYQRALGSYDGEATLVTSDKFATNKGTARIGTREKEDSQEELPIEMIQLDTMVMGQHEIGVLKIDVEGGELDVLRGMSQLLTDHLVRDIVFEETGSYPAPTHKYLKSKGYSIFGLEERFWGVRLLPDQSPRFDPQMGPNPNYLATCNPARARRYLKPPFWRSFGFLKFFANIRPNRSGTSKQPHSVLRSSDQNTHDSPLSPGAASPDCPFSTI